MKRFIYLLEKHVAEGVTLREIERKSGVTATSLSNYLSLGTEPRGAALEKLARYFHEPVAALLMEHDNNNYDERIIAALPRLTDEQKERLLAVIEEAKR